MQPTLYVSIGRSAVSAALRLFLLFCGAFLTISIYAARETASAQGSLIGRTLQAGVTVSALDCSSGSCIVTRTKSENVHLYFGTKGTVFDYVGAQKGHAARSGAWSRNPDGEPIRHTVRGNTYLFETIIGGSGRVNLVFTSAGGSCSVRWTTSGLPANRKLDVRLRYCRVTQGHQEPG